MLFLRRYTQSVDADCTERRAYNAVRDDGSQLLLLLLLNNLCDVTSRHVIFDLHLPLTYHVISDLPVYRGHVRCLSARARARCWLRLV